MDTLDDSIIICDTPPKSTRNKVLDPKKVQKNVKKTFYESPLKHIQLSSKRWKQRQTEQKLINNAKQLTKNQKNSFFSVKDLSVQDSIIILSDNETELNNQDNNKKGTKKRKKRKRPLETLLEDKHGSQCLNNLDNSSCQRETEKEICTKRRKPNSPVLSPNNNSCFLISDTDESEIIPLDLDDENIAPASSSANQTSDEIIVVWSSKRTSPLSSNHSEDDKNLTEEEKDKIFMIDHNPNPENLSYLEADEESSCNKDENSTEGSTKKGTEEGTEKSTKTATENSTNTTNEESSDEDAETSDGRKISKDLLFSNQGLKFPKAHNISKSIVMKKQRITTTFLNYRKRISKSTNNPIPTVCSQRSAETLDATLKISTRTKPSRFEPLRPELLSFMTESSRFEPLRPELPRLEPLRPELPRLEPSGSEQPPRLREIIIDGNNVAMAHRNNMAFSEEGIILVMNYFTQRGHKVKIFIPQYRRFSPVLEKLYNEGIVIFTPSRKVGGKRITPYDDRYILEYATVCGGIVISLDQYRDLYKEKPEWRDTIENRLLAPTFVGDYVMFPEDPLGRNGPSLEEFLRH